MNPAARVVIVVVLVAAGAGGLVWWRQQEKPHPPAPPPPPVAPSRPPAPPARPPAPAEPAIRHPMARGPSGALPPLAESDAYFKKRLMELLGRKQALSLLRLDDFARRFVVTVDSLGRDHASSELWPVAPVAGNGRFETEAAGAAGGGTVIASRNTERYATLLRLIESVDVAKAAAVYAHLYPLFQQAFEELGYPGKYFNDRVVEVIDDLLATPVPAGPLKVKLVEVNGPGGAPAPRKRELYQFEDPALEARSAGQKIMLRIGPDNAARLKAKLTEARRHIARGPGAN